MQYAVPRRAMYRLTLSVCAALVVLSAPAWAELSRDELTLGKYSKELQQIGGELTDAASGTVDFPGDLDGERISLCWRLDEPEILFWHSDDCGGGERTSLCQDQGSGEYSSGSDLQRG